MSAQGRLYLSSEERGATFSPCRQYRYSLWRRWSPLDRAAPRALFVMLNPSTADEDVDDPTIRRCIGFAQSWGYGSLEICNLFAWRATDPRAMLAAEFPTGGDNNSAILSAQARAAIVVAAWGAHGGHIRRDEQVLAMLAPYSDVHCLGVTRKDSKPLHPLYLPGWTQPELFRPKRERR